MEQVSIYFCFSVYNNSIIDCFFSKSKHVALQIIFVKALSRTWQPIDKDKLVFSYLKTIYTEIDDKEVEPQ